MFCHSCGAELPEGAAFCSMCGVSTLPNDARSGVFRHDLAMGASPPIASPQQAALPPTQLPSSGVPQNTPSAQSAPYTPTPLPPRRRRFRPFGLPLDSAIFASWGALCFFLGSALFIYYIFPGLSNGVKQTIILLSLLIPISISFFILRRRGTPSLGLRRRFALEMGVLLIALIMSLLVYKLTSASITALLIILMTYGLVTYIVAYW